MIGGSIPEREGENVYNTCLVFDKNGSLLARHRLGVVDIIICYLLFLFVIFICLLFVICYLLFVIRSLFSCYESLLFLTFPFL